ncbi:hypothetical protein TUM4438_40180 [Shewanella sairae]|uniref:Uncharacterized protein n=1 Tax=Shewanella sairae TaxID=190310 RepID=A0ABQ4PQ98_9GAMM|nr:hypothetical protein [Shewanella sairae]MCL1132151.1 hypothetical protein [Shewanella sairae]GIU51240.1 hypothetical protein TUM4438_40180 [Shewanella sairae]
MEKKLRDIRYYASDEPNSSGKGFPSSCSRFFDFPKNLHYWGGRISQIVGPEGLSFGDFDHLYINFTSGLPLEEIQFSERAPEGWMRYIDFGVSFDTLKGLNEQELEQFLVNSTFKLLSYLCHGDKEKLKIVENVKSNVEEYGSEVELPVKLKETKSYSVSITYKLRPNNEGSYGIVKYTNLKSGESFRDRFIELKAPDDIFPLVGSIAIKDGKIVIKPRASFRAGLYTKSYSLPLEIDIAVKLSA